MSTPHIAIVERKRRKVLSQAGIAGRLVLVADGQPFTFKTITLSQGRRSLSEKNETMPLCRNQWD